MAEGLHSFEDLCRWLGCKHKKSVLEWFRERGIEPEFDAKGRPIAYDSMIRKQDRRPEVRL